MIGTTSRVWIAAAAALLVASQASAHFLWLEGETVDGKTTIHGGFGEIRAWESQFAENIQHAKYWIERPGAKPEPFSMTWSDDEDCYVGTLDKVKPATAVVGTMVWGIFSREGLDPSLLYYYPKTLLGDPADWNKIAPNDELRVEIIPTIDGSTTTLQVLVDGKPGDGATVRLYTPDSDEAETVQADSEGKTVWKTDQAGQYAVTVVHRIAKGGEHKGEEYQKEMHCASLQFTLPSVKSSAN